MSNFYSLLRLSSSIVKRLKQRMETTMMIDRRSSTSAASIFFTIHGSIRFMYSEKRL
ncbi:hypothetical protein NE237_026725 [Protea cynaroides]|uniref:Uncharacterized protein n=1 Tax=Protea cynaroides TaxID=273540 RepID=A0A9Q0GQ47_9MAGN|nr:hypothetical protein NE237_026725 [Protea cynaroides]